MSGVNIRLPPIVTSLRLSISDPAAEFYSSRPFSGGSMVMDIKQMIAGFNSSTFRHVRRFLNEAAPTLARSCDVSSSGFILDCAPDCIRKTLCVDVI